MGRLIDADMLKEKIERTYINGIKLSSVNAVIIKIVNDLISDAPTIEVPKWIPCSERLPNNFNEDETVLATTDVDGDRVITMFAVDVKTFYLKGYVSAWMPLPKPYEETDHE